MASTTSFYIIRFPISQEGRTAVWFMEWHIVYYVHSRVQKFPAWPTFHGVRNNTTISTSASSILEHVAAWNWYFNLTVDGAIYPSQHFPFGAAFVCQAGNFLTLPRIIPFTQSHSRIDVLPEGLTGLLKFGSFRRRSSDRTSTYANGCHRFGAFTMENGVYAVVQFVETRRYKPESHWFDSRCFHSNFSLT